MNPDDIEKEIERLTGLLGWNRLDGREDLFNDLLETFQECVIRLQPVFITDEQLEDKSLQELLDMMYDIGWIRRRRSPFDMDDMDKGMGFRFMPTEKLTDIMIIIAKEELENRESED